MYPLLFRRRVGNHFGKTTLIIPNQDANLNLPVIGSLVYCESSALAHAATETVAAWFNALLLQYTRLPMTECTEFVEESLDITVNLIQTSYHKWSATLVHVTSVTRPALQLNSNHYRSASGGLTWGKVHSYPLRWPHGLRR
uniref:Uncharacterized protein n=1 Tax=Timema monikensis TaxID=170555 RepID=A0A7R9E0P8_9NEOP|nr:unnamed protein product [Timema monikensis]